MSTSMTWEEICADPELRKLPHKIEQDRFGRPIVSPLPTLWHGRRQARIIMKLGELLPDWEISGDSAVQTAEGVRSPDVAALRPEHARELSRKASVIKRAPAICIEVLSPSNSEGEMEEKRRLYGEAGCEEFWTCAEDGSMTFFVSDGRILPRSALCPKFPELISSS